MLGWPVSDWSDAPQAAPPLDAGWHTLNDVARHTFTHFHLDLTVLTATVTQDAKPDRGQFVDNAAFSPASLPTVMRKVYDVAAATLT